MSISTFTDKTRKFLNAASKRMKSPFRKRTNIANENQIPFQDQVPAPIPTTHSETFSRFFGWFANKKTGSAIVGATGGAASVLALTQHFDQTKNQTYKERMGLAQREINQFEAYLEKECPITDKSTLLLAQNVLHEAKLARNSLESQFTSHKSEINLKRGIQHEIDRDGEKQCIVEIHTLELSIRELNKILGESKFKKVDFSGKFMSECDTLVNFFPTLAKNGRKEPLLLTEFRAQQTELRARQATEFRAQQTEQMMRLLGPSGSSSSEIQKVNSPSTQIGSPFEESFHMYLPITISQFLYEFSIYFF